MTRAPAVALSIAALLCAGAAPARAAEQFLGVDVQGRFVTFSSDGGHVVARGTAATSDGLRTLGLDALPDGRVLALDAAGRLYDVDPATLAAVPRFAGPTVAGGSAIEGPSTFTVSPDGLTALVASASGAQRIDLTSGTATPAPALRATAADGGALANPTVDTLPDGRLAGIDWARPAVATEPAPGAGLAELGGTAVDWFGPTRFSLDPSGAVGWIVTRVAQHRSVLAAVNPATGAAARAVRLDDGIDAVVALGPAPGSAVPAAPSGARRPLPPALDPSLPPDRFATKVSISLPRQTRADVLHRRGLLARFAVSARVRVIVVAMLGQRKVCAAELQLAPGSSRPVAHCSAPQLARLRHAPTDRLEVFFTFRDTRGAAVFTRRLRLRP
jgi:hypothetical protein